MIFCSTGLAFPISFDGSWSLKPARKPRVRASQEKSIIEVGKQQEKTNLLENSITITKGSNVNPKSQKVKLDDLPPLVNALKASAEQDTASFHFPGHNRGRAAPSSLSQLIGTRPFLHDLPELPELGNLFSPEGPILDAQIQAAKLFGASETWFLVGGTTCGIQAAIMATCSPGDFIILPRNSHISAFSAMVLSGTLPKYIVPKYDFSWDIAGGVTPSQVAKAIEELEMEGQKAAAVFVTSPTYHGMCSNLSEISWLCHSHSIPLIVDEAHGAHLGFHPLLPPASLKQGADIAIQSTHKVLCSLTQSSMLHMSGNIVDRERICRCLQTLQSSSPSYLLLASLDAARAQLSKNQETLFNDAVELAVETKNSINKIPGFSVLDLPGLSGFSSFPAIDPLRLNIGVWEIGLSGFEADKILFRDYGVVPELAGTRSITLAINLGTCREHTLRLVSGLRHLSAKFLQKQSMEERVDDIGHAPYNDFTMSLSPREAFFAIKKKVSIAESLGKVCGELICPYPPGIPLLIPGEVITQDALRYLLQLRSKGAVISGASDPLLSSIVVCSA